MRASPRRHCPRSSMASSAGGSSACREASYWSSPIAKDDSQTVAKVLGNAEIVRFAQVVIGG